MQALDQPSLLRSGHDEAGDQGANHEPNTRAAKFSENPRLWFGHDGNFRSGACVCQEDARWKTQNWPYLYYVGYISAEERAGRHHVGARPHGYFSAGLLVI